MKSTQHKRPLIFGLILATIFPVLGWYIFAGRWPTSLDDLQVTAVLLALTLSGVAFLGLPIVLFLRRRNWLTWLFVLISAIVLGYLYYQFLAIFLLDSFKLQHLVWGTTLGLLAGVGFCVGTWPTSSLMPTPLRGVDYSDARPIDTMKRILSVIFGTLGVYCSLIFFNAIFLSDLTHTLDRNKDINDSFIKAAYFVDEFKRKNQRLPNENEFSTWKSSVSLGFHSPDAISISSKNFPDDALTEFGSPPGEAYVLSYWRGKWWEYYASWVKRSTVPLKESEYFVSGSRIADAIIFLLLSAMLFSAMEKLWKGPNNSFKRTAAPKRE